MAKGVDVDGVDMDCQIRGRRCCQTRQIIVKKQLLPTHEISLAKMMIMMNNL